jgi:hypothetical protein
MSEEALQQLLDRQEITDGLHWYTKWVDLNRVDKQVEIFAEDGRITFAGDDAWTVGRENIRIMNTPLVASYAATHHYITNIEINFEGPDQARSQCNLYAWHRPKEPGPDFELYAQYHDIWVRTADGWKIQERRLKTAGTVGFDAEAAGLVGLGRAD